jgi:hypothetical protein
MEDKCLLFDFEFLKSISEPSFVQEYNKSLQRFMTLLNDKYENRYAGTERVDKSFLPTLFSPTSPTGRP